LVLPGNESALAQWTTPAARQQVARAAVDMPVVLTQVPAGRTPGELRPGPRAGARPWDGAASREIARPIPAGKCEPLTDVERQTIIRWIDLGARRIAEPEATPKAEAGP
jgi:hypothetical protein